MDEIIAVRNRAYPHDTAAIFAADFDPVKHELVDRRPPVADAPDEPTPAPTPVAVEED